MGMSRAFLVGLADASGESLTKARDEERTRVSGIGDDLRRIAESDDWPDEARNAAAEAYMKLRTSPKSSIKEAEKLWAGVQQASQRAHPASTQKVLADKRAAVAGKTGEMMRDIAPVLSGIGGGTFATMGQALANQRKGAYEAESAVAPGEYQTSGPLTFAERQARQRQANRVLVDPGMLSLLPEGGEFDADLLPLYLGEQRHRESRAMADRQFEASRADRAEDASRWEKSFDFQKQQHKDTLEWRKEQATMNDQLRRDLAELSAQTKASLKGLKPATETRLNALGDLAVLVGDLSVALESGNVDDAHGWLRGTNLGVGARRKLGSAAWIIGGRLTPAENRYITGLNRLLGEEGHRLFGSAFTANEKGILLSILPNLTYEPETNKALFKDIDTVTKGSLYRNITVLVGREREIAERWLDESFGYSLQDLREAANQRDAAMQRLSVMAQTGSASAPPPTADVQRGRGPQTAHGDTGQRPPRSGVAPTPTISNEQLSELLKQLAPLE